MGQHCPAALYAPFKRTYPTANWAQGIGSTNYRPCLSGMEACGTANHWARELTSVGHIVRLIPPAHPKAYLRRNKNDAAAVAGSVKR